MCMYVHVPVDVVWGGCVLLCSIWIMILWFPCSYEHLCVLLPPPLPSRSLSLSHPSHIALSVYSLLPSSIPAPHLSLSLSLSHLSPANSTPPIHVGCCFNGTRTEVAEHKKVCSFKDETQLLAIAMKEVCTCNFTLGPTLCDSICTCKLQCTTVTFPGLY